MIAFARECLCDVIQEVDALLKLHYEELTLHKERIKLDPDWPMYTALEHMERLVLFTARDDGRLVGYAAFFVQPHIHYRKTIVAQNDVLFLHPEHRKGTTGIRFIRFSEQCLQGLKVDKIIWHVKFSLDLRPILHRLGYADEEVMVGKMLKG